MEMQHILYFYTVYLLTASILIEVNKRLGSDAHGLNSVYKLALLATVLKSSRKQTGATMVVLLLDVLIDETKDEENSNGVYSDDLLSSKKVTNN